MLILGSTGAAPGDPYQWITTGGSVGCLAFFIWCFLTGRVVSKGTHERVLSERNRLLELALTSARAASAAVQIAHTDREEIKRIAGTTDVEV